MKQIARIISTYTADVSGVCSALYELGGMVVMHDPSGCNSTYNTHDEPRWYHMDSLIFISGLAEIDAVLGNDEKLIDELNKRILAGDNRRELVEQYMDIKELDRETVETMIDHIVVGRRIPGTKNYPVEIHWNF